MPRNRRPSFLTRQKEQQRRAKAAEKRDARRARKKARVDNPGIESDIVSPDPGAAEEAEAAEATEATE